ncbi:MAG: hypothetical protein Q8P45_02830, partial [Candidatus Harrisonbacteria bacterium]|nr:hypothetical protein [Candidatus Harrisonbacteria bacterium]
YLEENIGEIWFDRAHNIFVDGFVSLGLVGVLIWTILVSFFIRTLLRARRHQLIGATELHIFSALVIGHIVQLQTAFNTVGSYVILSFILGYGLWLERNILLARGAPLKPLIRNVSGRKITAVALALLSVFALYQLSFNEYLRQRALVQILSAQSSEQQLKLIEGGLKDTHDFESLRISSASFLKGWFEQLGSLPRPQAEAVRTSGMEQLRLYQSHYEAYLKKAPQDYRGRMNYAYILITRSTFGEDHFDQAREVIRGSYEFSPQNPLSYVLDSLVSLYRGELDEAETLLNQALALNPDIEFTQEIISYFEKQKAQFPQITLLKLGNL